MMMALMENAAMLAVKDELPEGCTTVGGHMSVTLDEDAISDLCCQFPIPADYDGVGLY